MTLTRRESSRPSKDLLIRSVRWVFDLVQGQHGSGGHGPVSGRVPRRGLPSRARVSVVKWFGPTDPLLVIAALLRCRTNTGAPAPVRPNQPPRRPPGNDPIDRSEAAGSPARSIATSSWMSSSSIATGLNEPGQTA
jgi:hypothetical protein